MFQAERAAMCYRAGLLVAVRYGTHEDLPAPPAIVLDFEHGSWALSVDEDDDTVLISDGRAPLPEDLRFGPAPEGSPWADALGAGAQWVWVLENQQGYHDGLQFAFARDGRGVCQIQLTAVASGWHVHELRRVGWPSP